MRSYLPFIWKDSVTRIVDLAVYVKGRLPFAFDLALKVFKIWCFSVSLISFSVFFLFGQSFSTSFFPFFESVSSNIDEVLSINSSDNVCASEDFNAHHKDWWVTYSSRTDTLGRVSYNFSISHDLTQIANILHCGH